uniref:Uncharacterized protein n=1 Tax=Arundo donax TaxID=35708 RepID=A0A0A8YBS9_ARUDO
MSNSPGVSITLIVRASAQPS